MSDITLQKFSIIGISVRTTNENGQSSIDIPALWNRFMTEGMLQEIPNRICDDLYCIYCDYEKDHTRPYTTILGCVVSDTNDIPHGMIGKTFDEAKYIKQVAKGNIPEGMVFDEWVKIWNADIPRAFIADFEVYGKNASDPANAEVDIFLSVI
ncbi:MAG: effector binding domain-containing protein [Ferruginibacter sp.]